MNSEKKKGNAGFILPQVMIFILFIITLVSVWVILSQNEDASIKGGIQALQAKHLAQMGMERAKIHLLEDRDWLDFNDKLFDTDFLGGHYTTSLSPIDRDTVDITSIGTYLEKKYTFTKRYIRPDDIAWEMFVNKRNDLLRINFQAGKTTIKIVQISMVNVTENRVVQQMRVAWLPQNPGERLSTIRLQSYVFNPTNQEVNLTVHDYHHTRHDTDSHFHHTDLTLFHHHFHDIGNDPVHDTHPANLEGNHHHHIPNVAEAHVHHNDKMRPFYGDLLVARDFTFNQPNLSSHSDGSGPADHSHLELRPNELVLEFPQNMVNRTYSVYFYFTDGSVQEIDLGPEFSEESI